MSNSEDHSEYQSYISSRLDNVISDTDLSGFGLQKVSGKVRDVYTSQEPSHDNIIILVATDRISAFDRILSSIPYKGQVLSEISTWWFKQVEDILPNHILAHPDPNVVIGKKATVFPIEFVVRGYITGTTSTSMWTNYAKGVRSYCGLELPEGLVQNQRLDSAVVTPTTKETEHDRLISPKEIASEGWMSAEDYEYCAQMALKIFQRGQEIALKHGLLLVDTKYEFGKDKDGKIMIVDELHTPDSSRYWIASSYEERFQRGQTPESIDKDIIRRWYNERCDPYHDKVLPRAPEDLIVTLSLRYIELYERITGLKFKFGDLKEDPITRISKNISNWLSVKTKE